MLLLFSLPPPYIARHRHRDCSAGGAQSAWLKRATQGTKSPLELRRLWGAGEETVVGCRSQRGLSGEGSRSWALKTVQGGGQVLSRYGGGKAQGGGAAAVGF